MEKIGDYSINKKIIKIEQVYIGNHFLRGYFLYSKYGDIDFIAPNVTSNKSVKNKYLRLEFIWTLDKSKWSIRSFGIKFKRILLVKDKANIFAAAFKKEFHFFLYDLKNFKIRAREAWVKILRHR